MDDLTSAWYIDDEDDIESSHWCAPDTCDICDHKWSRLDAQAANNLPGMPPVGRVYRVYAALAEWQRRLFGRIGRGGPR